MILDLMRYSLNKTSVIVLRRNVLEKSVEEFFLSVRPSSSAEVRMVVVNEIKEVEGAR